MPQLRMQIKSEDSYKQDIDSLTHSLRTNLSNLGVEDARPLYEKPPPDSNAFDVALGLRIVDFSGGGY